MIFLAVGTQFPFDRLVRAVDKAMDNNLIDEEIFAQIGKSAYRPRNFEAVPFVDKQSFDKYICQASSVIGHAGMGIVAAVLEHGKPMLAMPRRRKYGEVINDHQVAIARKFEEIGYILAAYGEDELESKIGALKSFTPKPWKTQIKPLTDRISNFLKTLSENRK